MARTSENRARKRMRRLEERRRALLRGAGLAGGLCMCVFCAPAWAGPPNPTVVAGSATVNRAGSITNITASNNAILNYPSFSIGPGETVRFIQPGPTSRVFNRITGADPSIIEGRLIANGIVYIVNPAGVYFRQGSLVNVGGIYASAGHLSDGDFLAGVNHFTGLSGPVVNEGSITGDRVALIGATVMNSGQVTASSTSGTVVLAAGSDVLMSEQGSRVYVKVGSTAPANGAAPAANSVGVTNTGTIDAGTNGRTTLAAGDLYSVAIRTSGQIRARNVAIAASGGVTGALPTSGPSGGAESIVTPRGVVEVAGTITAVGSGSGGANANGGTVTITGPAIAVQHATIDASAASGSNGRGGTIHIGGEAHGGGTTRRAEMTSVSNDSTIRADGAGRGAGGEIVVWSDLWTGFYGSASAQGGSHGGDGGWIETSGHIWLSVVGASVRTGAGSGGKNGTWLLDPLNVTIDTFTNNGSFDGGSPDIFHPSGGPATVDVSTITDALSFGTSVEIGTYNGSTVGTGNILVNTPINVSVDNGPVTLTLRAADDINVANAITATNGPLTLALLANNGVGPGGSGASFDATPTVGSVTISAPIATNGGAFSAGGVNFTSTAAGTIDTGGASMTLGTFTGSVTVGAATTSGAASITAGGAVNLNAGVTTSGGGTLGITNGGLLTVASAIAADGAVSQTGAGAVALNAGVTTTHDTISFAAPVTLGSSVTLSTGGGAGGGNITFSGTLNGAAAGAQNLTLTAGTGGNITFGGAVGNLARLNTLTVNSANNVTAASTVDVVGLTQVAGSGTTTFGGLLTVQGAINLTGNAFSILGGATTTNGGQLAVANNGLLTINNSTVTLDGGLNQTGTGGVSLGTVSLVGTGDSFHFASAVTLSGATTSINTGGGAANITFDGAINGAAAAANGLTLSAAGGTVTFTGAVGAGTRVGAISIASVNNVTFASTLTAASVAQAAGTGTTTFTGAVNTSGVAGIALTGNNFTFGTGGVTTTSGGAMSVANAGLLSIGMAGAGAINLDGAFAQTNGAGTVTLAANISTTNDNVSFAAPVTLASDVALAPGSGNVSFASTLNGARNFTVSPGAGTATFTGAIGGVTPLTSITVTRTGGGGTALVAGATSTGAQTYTGPVTLSGNVLTTNADVQFNGAVALGGAAPAITVSTQAVAGAGDVTFGGTVNGGKNLAVNAGTGVITFTGAVGNTTPLGTGTGAAIALNTSGLTTFSSTVAATSGLTSVGPVTLRDNVTISGANTATTLNGDVTLDGLTFTSAGAVTFGDDATVDFVSVSGGPVAINATNAAITFNAEIAGNQNLAVNAGTGVTRFNAAVGNIGTGVGPAISLGSSGATFFESTVTARSGLLVAGPVTFRDNILLAAGTVGSIFHGNVTLDGLTINANNTLTFGDSAANTLTLSGGAVSINTGLSNITFNARVDGAQDFAVDAGTAVVTFNAAVGSATPIGDGTGAALFLNSDGATIFNSTLATRSGIQSISPTTFRDNVNIASGDTANSFTNNVVLDGLTLTAARAITFGTDGTNTLALSGGPVTINTSSGNGAIVVNSTVNGAQNLAINTGSGAATFNAAVGNTTPIGTGLGAALTLTSSGATTFNGTVATASGVSIAGPVTFTENVTIAAGNTPSVFNGAITLDGMTLASGGGLTFGDSNADALTLSGGAVSISATNAPIVFNATVDGAENLAVNSGTAATTFNAIIGAGTSVGTGAGVAIALGSTGLTTFGTTLIATSGITAVGPVAFGGNVAISGSGAGSVFNGNVALRSINFFSAGAVTFGDAAADAVTLESGIGASVRLNIGGAAVFNATVNGGRNLVLNNATSTVFNAPVGAVTPIGSGTGLAIDIESSGPTTFNSTVAAASGMFNDAAALTFRDNVTLAAGNAATELNGAVTLDGLTFTSRGATAFNTNGGAVTLSGGPVTIDTHLAAGGGAAVTFNGAVDGAQNLAINAGSAATTFADAVGAVTPIGTGTGAAITLTSTGATSFQDTLATASAITAAGPASFAGNVAIGGSGATASTFASDVTLAGITFASNGAVTFGDAAADGVHLTTGAVTITSANRAITFNAAIDGVQDLTIDAGSGATNFNAAVGTPVAPIGDGTGASLKLLSTGASVFASTLDTANGFTTAGPATFRDNVTVHAASTPTVLGGATTLDGLTFMSPGAITFSSTVALSGAPVTIDTHFSAFTGADVAFNGAVSGNQALAVDTGAGAIDFNAPLALTGPTSSITLNGGAITLAGTVATGGNFAVTHTGGGGSPSLTFSGSSVAIGGTFDERGGPVTLATASFTTSGRAISFHDAITLGADVTINSGAGPMLFLGDIDSDAHAGGRSLALITSAPTINGLPSATQLRAYRIPVAFGGSIGANTPLANFSINDGAAGRTSTPTVATILFSNSLDDDAGVTFAAIDPTTTFTIHTLGAFNMGPREKLLALGNLGVTAASARLSDISTLGNLAVTSPTIRMLARPRGQVVGFSNQGLLTVANDVGVDFVAGGTIAFSSSPTPINLDGSAFSGGDRPTFSNPDGTGDVNGTLGAFPFRAFGSAVNVIGLFHDRPAPTDVFALPLDLRSDGPTTQNVSETIAAFVRVDLPVLPQGTSISLAQKEELAKISIFVKDITSDELVEFLIGRALYNDRPRVIRPTRPGDREVSAGRLSLSLVQRTLAAYAVVSDNGDAMQGALTEAATAFFAANPDQDFNPKAFADFVRQRGAQDTAYIAMQRLGDLFIDVEQLGLSTGELVDCKNAIVVRVMPGSLNTRDMVPAVEAFIGEKTAP